MTQAPAAVFKIPTESPQPARKAARPARRAKAARPAPGRVLANGTGRAATRGGGEVVELGYGITVYPAREESGRWRAVWYEDGKRQQCEAGTEQKLAAKLEKVTERLEADAPNMKLPGAALIRHYLDPDRLPVDERWSRKHADTQRRLCERLLPVTEDSDEGGAGDADVGVRESPAVVVCGGALWGWCRWLWVRCRGYVSVTSVMAARAACSSTMALLLA